MKKSISIVCILLVILIGFTLDTQAEQGNNGQNIPSFDNAYMDKKYGAYNEKDALARENDYDLQRRRSMKRIDNIKATGEAQSDLKQAQWNQRQLDKGNDPKEGGGIGLTGVNTGPARARRVMGTGSASADEWVSGYTKKNGTYVEGYYRNSPDSYKYNNRGSQTNGGSQRD